MSKGVYGRHITDAWHIEGGKLYVFADKNVRDDWVASLGDGSLDKSAANWLRR